MERESLIKFVRYAFYVVLVGSLLCVLIPMEPPQLKPSLVQIVLQQLTILIVVALFLERALEVYKLSYFSPTTERLESQVEQHQMELEAQAKTENGCDFKANKTVQLYLINAQENLRVHKNHTRQSLLQAAVVFGLLIGSVGVRSLENAFDFPASESVLKIFRLYLFRVLDVILTAGLIAGGSEGIHGVIKKLSNLVPDIPQKIVDLVQSVRKDSV